MSPAELIRMANYVQQHAAELQARENQMMTQFQEVMCPWNKQIAHTTGRKPYGAWQESIGVQDGRVN